MYRSAGNERYCLQWMATGCGRKCIAGNGRLLAMDGTACTLHLAAGVGRDCVRFVCFRWTELLLIWLWWTRLRAIWLLWWMELLPNLRLEGIVYNACNEGLLAIEGTAINLRLATCNGWSCLLYSWLQGADMLPMWLLAKDWISCNFAACNGQNCLQCGCLWSTELLAIWLLAMDGTACNLLASDGRNCWQFCCWQWLVLRAVDGCLCDGQNCLHFALGYGGWTKCCAIWFLAMDEIACNMAACNGWKNSTYHR